MAKSYNPPMHTAEHVLNQAMTRLFACGRCFSSHLNADKSKCDYHFTRPLEEAEVKHLEAEVNSVLAQNLPVREYLLSYAEAAQKVDLSKLPDSKKSGTTSIRLIEIGDYDLCPCIGEHVQNTEECGKIHMISHAYTKNDNENSVLRLRFKLTKD